MIKGKVRVTITQDRVPRMRASLASLSRTDVLVGVPEAQSARSGGITNAELTYIHTHGVRTKGMAGAMDQMMLSSTGVPHTLDYDKFMANIGKGMPYSQALSLYIHEHGSAAWRIPPRPIIEPAIEDPENKDVIVQRMRATAGAALDGDPGAAENGLKTVGMVAAEAVRMWFVNPRNRWAPDAPATIKAKGSERPLVNTGQLRRAITYVLRQKGGPAM